MTPAQKKALRRLRQKLKNILADAAMAATTPGRARTWFVPYLAAVLEAYENLTTQRVDGKAMSKAFAKDPRTAFFKLLTTSKRDSKTRSRWAAALAHAHGLGISPEKLPKWLRKGGGVAGRAAELASVARTPKQTANQPQHRLKPTSLLNAPPETNDRSPEVNDPLAEATNSSND